VAARDQHQTVKVVDLAVLVERVDLAELLLPMDMVMLVERERLVEPGQLEGVAVVLAVLAVTVMLGVKMVEMEDYVDITALLEQADLIVLVAGVVMVLILVVIEDRLGRCLTQTTEGEAMRQEARGGLKQLKTEWLLSDI
jgi:hypothetical protein